MFRRLILPCLGVLVFCSQDQAFGSQTKKCTCYLEEYKMFVQQLKGLRTNGYHIVATFRIQYQHVDDDEIIATSKKYTKDYNVAASSKREAEGDVEELILEFGQEELAKQCKEKGCKTSK